MPVNPDYAMEQLDSSNYFITFVLSSSTSSLWLKYLSSLCMKIKMSTPDFCFSRGNKSRFSKHLDPGNASFTYSVASSLKFVGLVQFFETDFQLVTEVTKGLTSKKVVLLLVWKREYLEHKEFEYLDTK